MAFDRNTAKTFGGNKTVDALEALYNAGSESEKKRLEEAVKDFAANFKNGDEYVQRRSREALVDNIVDFAKSHSDDKNVQAALVALTGDSKAGDKLATAEASKKRMAEIDAIRNPRYDDMPKNNAQENRALLDEWLKLDEARKQTYKDMTKGLSRELLTGPYNEAPAAAVAAAPAAVAAAPAPVASTEPKFDSATKFNAQGIATDLQVENGGTLDVKTLQKALLQNGQHLDKFGADGKAKAGGETAAALLAMRKGGKHAGDTSLRIYADEIEKIKELAKLYDEKHKGQRRAAEDHVHPAPAPAAERKAGAPAPVPPTDTRADTGKTVKTGAMLKTVEYTAGPELAAIDPNLVKTMVAFGGDVDKGKVLDMKWFNDRATQIGKTYAQSAMGKESIAKGEQTKPFNVQVAEMMKQPIYPIIAGSEAPLAETFAAKTPTSAKLDPARLSALSTEAKLELVADVSGNAAALKGGSDMRRAVAQYQEQHPEVKADTKGTLNGATMTSMVEDYAKKKGYNLDAAVAKLEAEAAQRVAAKATPTRSAALNVQGPG